jgi:hypothetical protein
MLLSLFLLSVFMQSPSAQATPPEARHFDFWIGEWAVYQNGQLAGHNKIVPIAGGNVLHENWKGASGTQGTSLNHYDPSTGKWHQSWVWQNGTTLPKRTGGLEGKSMVLQGVQKTGNGELTHKIAWTPNGDGTVRQHWQISRDGGKTWQTSFDGIYKPEKQKN